MNGIILRLGAYAPLLLSLSSGFALGVRFDLRPVQTVEFKGVEWIDSVTPSQFSFKHEEPEQELVTSLEFTPYSLTTHPAPRLSTQLAALKEVETLETHFSSALSTEEQNELSSLLLKEQLKSRGPKSVPQVVRHAEVPRVRPLMTETPGSMTVVTKETVDPGTCGLGLTHSFERPETQAGQDPQAPICPEKATWLSKNWASQGWVKFDGSAHLPTLVRQPAPNSGTTPLFDEVSLGLLALKSGIRNAKGMGTVIGLLPEGYQVEYSGRAEETEYFDSHHRKFFAILNAEPGSGIVDLVSGKGQDLSATVFVPVLEDTITYLDLSAPLETDLKIRVTKNAKHPDPEISGLTVGLSAHNAIQGVTRSDGLAELKKVRHFAGYPVFIDVSSRDGDEPGPTYRYLLNGPGPDGVFEVAQLDHRTRTHWLEQAQTSISDQAGMVVGRVDPKRIDGFKMAYHAKVEPLTPKIGLDPLNLSVMWDGTVSGSEPLEGDIPRFMSLQVSEGLGRFFLTDENKSEVFSELFPASSRVIHVINP